MKPLLHQLESEYPSALKDYLANPGEAALTRAYELGRAAVAQELGLLDMATLHHEALARILPGASTPEETARVLKEAKNFFAESLTPFEMAYRGFHDATSALRGLNDKLEEEAKRIAHAIHDEAGQFLACVHIALEEIARELPLKSRKQIEEVRGLLDKVEGQLRRLSHELRPTILDDLGLLPALEFLANGVSKRAGLQIDVKGRRDGRLPAGIETALYRVVQEALNNATKHAQAKRASVHVERQTGAIRCLITDDGVGFDVSATMARKGQASLGLLGIRERIAVLGGTLEIHSQPGRGTEMVITVPLEG